MVPDLTEDSAWDRLLSHPFKPLLTHTGGVTDRVVLRTTLPVAKIAALLHDAGKVNPEFQRKLTGLTGTGYSSHAYLSALTFLCYPRKTGRLGLSCLQCFSVAAIAARHHGNLPNFAGDTKSERAANEVVLKLKSVLSEEEYLRAARHIEARPEMPLAAFACRVLKDDRPFAIRPPAFAALPSAPLPLGDALRFFLETQFAFACLLESDKRDAGDNDAERRAADIDRLCADLSRALLNPPPAAEAEPPPNEIALNEARTQIRMETLRNLKEGLRDGRRLFMLNAPTGAGKTRTLLAAATDVLEFARKEGAPAGPLRGILYCLPFLSITEQVEEVCSTLVDRELFLRADSSAHNPAIEALMTDADGDPAKTERLLREDFAELVFDSPLVITTFVQLFETLMSNRNATLLKLPNFARSVIIIDEVQALPPRLYAFFAAYLDAFCREFNAYVLFSTATMPFFELVEDPKLSPREFFQNCYQAPYPLVATDHTKTPCFQRYVIEPHWDIGSLEQLAAAVRAEADAGRSVLVVLNTIKSTRTLFDLLSANAGDAEVMLLNTRFIPFDRRAKIARAKRLGQAPPLILVTTQLVEAGVDIDFPVVYRDLCPLPSLIQTAGRCNRHNRNPDRGKVVLVDIKSEKGSSVAEQVYLRGMDAWYLDFTRSAIQRSFSEEEFDTVQKLYFEEVKSKLRMGKHPGLREDRNSKEMSNLLLCVRDAAFADAGKFRLIEEQGDQYAFYVPDGPLDNAFETLEGLATEQARLKQRREFDALRVHRIRLESHLRAMRQRVVQARMKESAARELCAFEPVMGMRKLYNPDNYTSTYGLEAADDDNCI